MKITAIAVEQFGVWQQVKLRDLPDGLCVLYGPNEAGKTTLLHFIRGMLFGFADEALEYVKNCNSACGGRLWISHFGRRYCIHRAIDPQSHQQTLSVTDDRGHRLPDTTVAEILAPVDRETFGCVYAIGLRELHSLAVLTESQAARLLFATSAGLGVVRLADCFQSLQTAREQLLSSRGQHDQIGNLLNEYCQLQQRLVQSRETLQQYRRLQHSMDQLQRQIGHLEAELHELQQQQELLRLATVIADRWNELQAIERRLETLPRDRLATESALEELDQLEAAIVRKRNAVHTTQSRLQRASTALQAIVLDHRWQKAAPQISNLCQQLPWVQQARHRLGQLQQELEQICTELSEQQRHFLAKENREEFSEPPSPALESLHSRWQVLLRTRRQCKRLQIHVQKAQQQAEHLSQELKQQLSAEQVTDLGQAIAEQSEQLSRLRQLSHLLERVEQLEKIEDEIRKDLRRLLDRQLLPLGTLLVIGAVFVASVVLMMAGLFMPRSITGIFAWPMALVGLVGLVSAIVAKVLLERADRQKLQAAELQLHRTIQERKEIQEQYDRLNRPSIPPEDLPRNIEQTQQQLAKLRQLLTLQSEYTAAQQRAESLEVKLQRACSQLEQKQKEWKDALVELGLSPELTFSQVEQLRQLVPAWNAQYRRTQALRGEAEQLQSHLEHFSEQVRRLASDLNLPQHKDTPEEILNIAAQRLEEEKAKAQRRKKLKRICRRLQKRQETAERVLKKLIEQRNNLLQSHRVQSREQLARLIADCRLADQLAEQRDRLRQEIQQSVPDGSLLQKVVAVLQENNRDKLFQQQEQLQARLSELSGQLNMLAEQRGKLSQELAQLAQDRTTLLLRYRARQIKHEVIRLLRRWLVLSLAERLLTQAKQSFEKRYQPATLRIASAYLAELTMGRYRRIWCPLDGETIFLETVGGEDLPVEQLSQGTRELLFVCLRLALARVYAEQGKALPIVLDDVVANFDAGRVKRMAKLLQQLGENGQQILLFTCHQHVAKVFAQLEVPVLRLDRKRRKLAATARKSPKAADQKQPSQQLADEHETLQVEETPDQEANVSQAGQTYPDSEEESPGQLRVEYADGQASYDAYGRPIQFSANSDATPQAASNSSRRMRVDNGHRVKRDPHSAKSSAGEPAS